MVWLLHLWAKGAQEATRNYKFSRVRWWNFPALSIGEMYIPLAHLTFLIIAIVETITYRVLIKWLNIYCGEFCNIILDTIKHKLNFRRCIWICFHSLPQPPPFTSCQSMLSFYYNFSDTATKMLSTFTFKGADKQRAREWVVNEILWL